MLISERKQKSPIKVARANQAVAYFLSGNSRLCLLGALKGRHRIVGHGP